MSFSILFRNLSEESIHGPIQTLMVGAHLFTIVLMEGCNAFGKRSADYYFYYNNNLY